jgi:single-strand DNA-binding protein
MAGEPPITLFGNLTSDPELRFTPSGRGVVSFTVASTPRVFDGQSGEWKNGKTLFLRCQQWGEPGEHVADSLHKGMRVIVSGRLRQRRFETRDGRKVAVVDVEVDEVGPSLRWATVELSKTEREE